MTAGSLMAAELAEQPQVLGRLVSRHVADRDQVRHWSDELEKQAVLYFFASNSKRFGGRLEYGAPPFRQRGKARPPKDPL